MPSETTRTAVLDYFLFTESGSIRISPAVAKDAI